MSLGSPSNVGTRLRYCFLASRNDCDVLEMGCDVVLNVLLLPLVVVLEMDCDVMLNVLLLPLLLVLEMDGDVVLDVLLLPLDADDDAAQHSAAEHS